MSSWDKREYLLRVIGTGTGKEDKCIVEAALVFYHADVPLAMAMEYVTTLRRKAKIKFK